MRPARSPWLQAPPPLRAAAVPVALRAPAPALRRLLSRLRRSAACSPRSRSRSSARAAAPSCPAHGSQLIQAPAPAGTYSLGMENNSTTSARAQGLLAWQLASYTASHHDRRNLMLHVVTAPIFMFGTVCALAAPAISFWLVPAGLLAMFAAIAIQGKGHALEPQTPAPFAGPRDVFARIFAEQWITFPRYVLSGGFRRAWRETA
jgi:hypothetical protein